MQKKQDIQIYVGTQTGTADNYARILQKDMSTLGFTGKITNLKDFHPSEFMKQEVVIFLLATYGEGDPPDNCIEFFKWLNEIKFQFTKMQFCIFGLGDSFFQGTFNNATKTLFKCLEEKGAKQFYNNSYSDNRFSVMDTFQEWKKGLWEPLILSASHINYFQKMNQMHGGNKPKINFAKNMMGISQNKCQYYSLQQYEKAANLKLLGIKLLTSENCDKQTFHLILQCPKDFTYQTSGYIYMYPENTDEDIKRIVQLMGLGDKLNEIIVSEEKIEESIPICQNLTVETYLRKYCEFKVKVSQWVIQEISGHCLLKQDKEYLQFLSSEKGKQNFKDEILIPQLNLIDLLEKYKIKLPLNILIHITQMMKARMFSIASSNKTHPNEIHLTITLEKSMLPDKSVRFGTNSKFLLDCYNNFKIKDIMIKCLAKPSSYAPSKMLLQPLIMVGTGSGIASFMGLIAEKEYFMQNNQKVHPLMLYYGCRKPTEDFLYKHQLQEAAKKGVLQGFHTAFSRTLDTKFYTKDLVRNYQYIAYEILFNNAKMLICGQRKMGLTVLKELVQIVSEIFTNGDLEEGFNQIYQRIEDKTIIQSVWN